MALFPALLLKTHRRLSTCATTMRVRFVVKRRRCATKVKMSQALAILNSNNFVVYVQKHKIWVLVFWLVRAEYFETIVEQIWCNFLLCNKTASSTATPFKKQC